MSPRPLLALAVLVLTMATIPHRICARDATAYFSGDRDAQASLASSVAAWTNEPLAPDAFATGTQRYDDEWRFGTYAMGAIGFAQIAAEHDEDRATELPRVEHCLDAMLSPASRAFDRDAWSEDPLRDLGAGKERGHVAYLGYLGLPLALHRALKGDARFDATESLVIAHLARAFEHSTIGLVETYPGELYPVDNAAALAAIAIHDRATGDDHHALLERAFATIRDRATDPKTGLLVQALNPDTGAAADSPRGSGTALASFFLSYADLTISRNLWASARSSLYDEVLGFGVMRESSGAASRQDIDSGPVVFGFGVSATGFSIGAARAHGDSRAFASLYATAHLFGAPLDEDGARTYATGGPIGDAILLAMLTAPRVGRS